MINKSIAALCCAFFGAVCVANASSPESKTASYEQRADELISKMTLEEKIGQINLLSNPYLSTGASESKNVNENIDNFIREGNVGSFLNIMGAEETYRLQKIATQETRLGIPLLFGYDVIHGFKTIFPIPLADAASFDAEAMRISAEGAAIEATANGLNWTFAPMVDIARDPRWGRIMEGSGEDVYLASVAAAAKVHGFQGESLDQEVSMAACAKHFAAYGAAIGGRDYSGIDVSERTLREVYFPPFQAAIDAGVSSIMSAFNTVNGEPASTSRWLLTDVLRGEWGFEGFVVSDWASVGETMAHGTAENRLEATYNGLNAGVDMDMCAKLYPEHTKELVESGRISVELLDSYVKSILMTKFQLGLFDDPYKYSKVERENDKNMERELRASSRDVAKKSIVLLKNEEQLLPITKKVKHIAVIGPLGDDKDTPLGNWRAVAEDSSAVSLVEGIRAAAPKGCEVTYTQGCRLVNNTSVDMRTVLDIETEDRSDFAAAVEAAKAADVVVIAVGENSSMTGECRSYGDIELKGLQKELLEEVYKAGTPVVMALFTGRPLVITEEVQYADAILNCWLLGSESGNAIADVLFGKYNPSGKLPASFPYSLGQVPIYYSVMNTGRPYNPEEIKFSNKYRDIPNSPLYAFGYGLSYTTFEYEALTLSSTTLDKEGEIKATVRVKNSGDYDGEEVIQLYIRDCYGKGISRPLYELKGFEKVMIQKGKSVEVEFTLTAEDLAFYRLDKTFAAESGDFIVYAGSASDNLPLQQGFTYKGDF